MYYRKSIIISLLFLITSFIPILQVMFAYFNGALLYPISLITDYLKIVNFIITLVFLYFYYKKHSYLLGFISAFFISGTSMFYFEDYFIDTDIYMKQFVMTSIIIALSLLTIDFIRKLKSEK